MTTPLTPTLFIRHHRILHALLLESEAWFCVPDLSRLMGCRMGERQIRKLDGDQHRVVRLLLNGDGKDTLMVNESGLYALLAYHYIPENRSLRQWLSHEVIPGLRGVPPAIEAYSPGVSTLHWSGMSLRMLTWQNEAWIRWQDAPALLKTENRPRPRMRFRWWRASSIIVETMQVRN